MNYWKDKVAVVTGGSSGFGRAIVRALAAAGARVGIAALDDDLLAAAAGELVGQGAPVLPLPADVTRQEDVDRLFAAALDRFGRLDMLVNCAGRSVRGAVLETSPDDFRDLLELNFFATVRCTRAAAPHLLASGGHLVNIGSLAAKIASKYLAAYPVSKFAVAAYSQQLRLELGPQGLHVLLVCPGPLAREDAGTRYNAQAEGLPESARKPGGGAKVRLLAPEAMAQRILRACERRQPELVVPGKARLLFAIAQLAPRWGDWILQRMTS